MTISWSGQHRQPIAYDILAGAYIINRASMPTGDLPGGLGEAFTVHRPSAAERDKWRRIGLGAGYIALGKSPVPISVDVSDPGATPFRTTGPVHWDDFHKSGGICWQAELSAGRGMSQTFVAFLEVTTRPTDVDVSNMVSGVPSVTFAQAARGWWYLSD